MGTDTQAPDWAALYARHRETMLRVAARRLQLAGRDMTEAQDIVNHAFRELMEKPPADVANWQAFLVRVTGRRVSDLLGSADMRRSAAVGLGTDEDSQQLDQDAGHDVQENALLGMRGDRLRQQVRDVLAGLPDSQRQVVQRRLFRGMTNVEIGRQLSVTPQRVSQLWAAGWAALTSAIRDDPTIWSDDEGDTDD